MSRTDPRSPRLARPEGAVRTTLSRTPDALNEYNYALSSSSAPVVRKGGRGGHWEVIGSLDNITVHVVAADEQYETPFCLFRHLEHRLGLSFTVDAMASPLSALAPRYFSRENSIYDAELSEEIIFLNPAYGRRRWDIGLDGFSPALQKLVTQDVRERGRTLVALLPNFSRQRGCRGGCRGRVGG